MSITTLPDEILEQILIGVPFKWLIAVSGVNRKWRNISRSKRVLNSKLMTELAINIEYIEGESLRKYIDRLAHIIDFDLIDYLSRCDMTRLLTLIEDYSIDAEYFSYRVGSELSRFSHKYPELHHPLIYKVLVEKNLDHKWMFKYSLVNDNFLYLHALIDAGFNDPYEMSDIITTKYNFKGDAQISDQLDRLAKILFERVYPSMSKDQKKYFLAIALAEAVEHEDNKFTDECLALGAVDVTGHALLSAAARGDLPLVQRLVKDGAPIYSGIYAITGNNTELLTYLQTVSHKVVH